MTLPGVESQYRWQDGLDYDATTAQATLAAIAGGMITLTGFVLTAVTLMIQTVQGQSSRLLQALNRTDKSPLLFGTFTATFTFSLIVLSNVTSTEVPAICVTLAILMVLVCAAMFLRLLVTFRSGLTVGGLTCTIGAELRLLIDVLYPAPFTGTAPPAAPKALTTEQPTWTIKHDGEPGVFQAFNERRAVRLAAKTGARIRFLPAIGDFVVTGGVLADGTGPAPKPRALCRLVTIGAARTLEQDPAYAFRMLVDIAVRALSPAVNDPTSAVQALDQIDDGLHRIACRSLGDGLLQDKDGQVLVRYPAPTWETFLTLATDEIVLFGSNSLQITRRMNAMLQDLLASTPEARWPAVNVKLAALRRATRRCSPIRPKRRRPPAPTASARHTSVTTGLATSE